jgi:hypothetical protein
MNPNFLTGPVKIAVIMAHDRSSKDRKSKGFLKPIG